jgi:hypothetical protein
VSILALIGLLFRLRLRRRQRACVEQLVSGKFDIVLELKVPGTPDTATYSASNQTYAPTSSTDPSASSLSLTSGIVTHAAASDAAAVGASNAAATTSSGPRGRQREQRSETQSATAMLDDVLSPSSPETDYSLDPETRYRCALNRNLSNPTEIGAQLSTAPLSS